MRSNMTTSPVASMKWKKTCVMEDQPLPADCVTVQDVVSYFDMNAQIGEIVLLSAAASDDNLTTEEKTLIVTRIKNLAAAELKRLNNK